MSFDLKARDWDKDPQKVSRAKVFADEIVGFLNGTKIDKALEFGSGTGLVSFNLYNRFGKIILADSSSGMTEVLREKIGNTGAENMEAFQIENDYGRTIESYKDTVNTHRFCLLTG